MKHREMNLDFMAVGRVLGIVSLLLVVSSVVLLATRGLNLGLDFTGGTLIELSSSKDIKLDKVRDVLNDNGYDDARSQFFGSARDAVIRVPPRKGENAKQMGHDVFNLVSSKVPDLQLQRVEFVGPQVGNELRDESGLALLMALGAMLVYVWFRFSNKFSVATVLALFHDVIIVLGAFALFQWQFDLTVLAAILALIGYSINDSIVVADHIREDFRNTRMTDPVAICNQALNKTFSRTILTSLTTFLVLLALLLFGGEQIRDFSIALTLGVVVGTYSSIYVATNLLLVMKVSKDDFIVLDKRDVDDRP